MRRCALLLFLLLLLYALPAKADLYNFGAIAFNSGTLDFGYAIDWGSRQQAVAEAMRRCKGKCSLVGLFWNNCGSMAIAQDGTYGWNGNGNKALSEQKALAACSQVGGSQCKIVVSVCNHIPQQTNSGSVPSPIPPRPRDCWWEKGSLNMKRVCQEHY